jgi:hypothetical protein
MDGYVWVVVEADGVEVKFQVMDTEGGGIDSNDEGEVGSAHRGKRVLPCRRLL